VVARRKQFCICLRKPSTHTDTLVLCSAERVRSISHTFSCPALKSLLGHKPFAYLHHISLTVHPMSIALSLPEAEFQGNGPDHELPITSGRDGTRSFAGTAVITPCGRLQSKQTELFRLFLGPWATADLTNDTSRPAIPCDTSPVSAAVLKTSLA